MYINFLTILLVLFWRYGDSVDDTAETASALVLVAASSGMRAVTLHRRNPPVLDWGCRLTQIDMHNGRKTVVVVVVVVVVVIYYYFLRPRYSIPGNEKITLCSTKKYKNQAGMNLPPLPSQNSHAVRRHCNAESKLRVA